ncbi:MAG: ABC transporter substrate-binding protein [Proteobacteria bacterium]|nr:ABC transporter substrate-binding protein [Pseudomonadota bacterium]
MRQRLLYIAAALVAVALVTFASYFLGQPRTLRIAVGPSASQDHRVAVAFMQALQRDSASIRLKIVTTDGPISAARALESGKADLAVIRSDLNMPTNAATLAIMRKVAIHLIANPASGIGRIRDLKGKKVGVVSSRPIPGGVLTRVLGNYGLTLSDVEIVRGTLQEVGQAVSEGKVDASLLIAPLNDRNTRLALQAFPSNTEGGATLMPIPDAEALAREWAEFDTIEVPRAAFNAEPAQPDAPYTTLAVTYRLVAPRALDDGVVSEVTQLLFSLRPAMVAEAPHANQIELPDTEDRGARLPTHAGTIAYVEGETKTFFERYGDWIYLGIMGFSLVGSVLAAAYSRVSSGRTPADIDKDLEEIGRLIAGVQQAETIESLSGIADAADRARADLVQLVIATGPDSDKIAAIEFLLRELKERLDSRRATLASDHNI